MVYYKKIIEYLDIIDLYHFYLINKYTYNTFNLKDKLKEYYFLVITNEINKYINIINYIIQNDINININIYQNYILLHNKSLTDIKINSRSFQYFYVNKERSFNFNINNLKIIKQHILLYDNLYIYQKIDESKIYIDVRNKFGKKKLIIINI